MVKETGQEFIRTVILGNGTEACIKEYTLRFAAGILKLVSEFHENAEREWGLLSIITQITNAMSSQEAADQFGKSWISLAVRPWKMSMEAMRRKMDWC